MEVINEEPISSVELRAELERIKKRDKELNFRGNKTEEYLGHFVSLDKKKAQELSSKIQAIKVPRLKKVHIIKLMDVMPVTPEEVKLVLQGFTITVNQENLKKLAKAIEEFV